MWIVKLASNPNGSHDDHCGDHITKPPVGWAMIPEGMHIPETFPFVDIEAENVATGAETIAVVTSMTAGVMPEPNPEEEQQPTQLDILEAQVTYTAMMTDTLLEV